MTDRSWLPVAYILFKVGTKPFPSEFYRAEEIGGLENDAKYIMEQLDKLDPRQRANACEAYSSVYIHQGRYEANTRLRAYVKACIEKKN